MNTTSKQHQTPDYSIPNCRYAKPSISHVISTTNMAMDQNRLPYPENPLELVRANLSQGTVLLLAKKLRRRKFKANCLKRSKELIHLPSKICFKSLDLLKKPRKYAIKHTHTYICIYIYIYLYNIYIYIYFFFFKYIYIYIHILGLVDPSGKAKTTEQQITQRSQTESVSHLKCFPFRQFLALLIHFILHSTSTVGRNLSRSPNLSFQKCLPCAHMFLSNKKHKK